ncbi:MAG: AMP-binding protein [Clostridium sp.]|nr:AMP-binding protein [Clostridium sp.]
MIAVILAAGKGTRLSEFYSCGSKCMIPINGQPLIAYTVKNLSNCKGLKKICIVISSHGKEIPSYLGKEYNSIPIEYYVQDENNMGIINAVYSVGDLLEGKDEEIIINLGDEYYESIAYDELIRRHKERKSAVTPVVVYSENEDKVKKNYTVDIVEGDEIVDAIEKPSKVFNNYVGTGVLLVSKSLLKDFAYYCNYNFYEKQLVDWINFAIKTNRHCYAEKIDTKFCNLNYQKDLEEIYKVFHQENTESMYSRYKKIIALYPDRKAVVFKNKTLTFKELDQKSDLIALSIKKCQCVGIKNTNPIEFVISIIAVLKAEAYYVILKDSYSEEVINYIIEKLNVYMVIKEKLSICKIELNIKENELNCADRASDYAMALFLESSKSFNMIPEKVILNLLLSIENIAFNRIESSNIQFGIVSESLNMESFQFVYSALLCGKTLNIISKTSCSNINDFINELNSTDICHLTPSMVSEVTNYIERKSEIQLSTKVIILNEMKLDKELIHSFFSQCKSTDVINMYSMKENYNYCTAFYMNKEIENKLEEIPIGKPIRNARTYILDSNKKIVGVGVVGDVWIAGDVTSIKVVGDKENINKGISLDIINNKDLMFYTGDKGYLDLEGNIYLK